MVPFTRPISATYCSIGDEYVEIMDQPVIYDMVRDPGESNPLATDSKMLVSIIFS
jgi:hypothetical protein